ncbi:restriction endonuclease subunit S [Rhizobium sp. 32-5/1]|uniref:restriction endonuclease subunit S n=1 Tax=Rhizobium sp. 32-5/1 TaxID=3019602 RepID=UPI00240E9AB7|nr:restriction endonuclease subunit S [Rhizobium sp. 32-5/1]WEZ83435.1 restriction endonuclease subunit S [Rhizobium sp. 32-5/1]
MSGLDYLIKLLDGAEVEWKPLADVTMSTSNIRWRDTERTYRYIDLTSVSIETKCITQTTEIDAKNAPSRAQKLVEQDDVIFATTRPSQQRYCLIDEEYAGEVASTGYCVLRAKKGEVLPKWILHCISSSEFKSYVEERQSGAAYPAISDAIVKAFSIPIPCPESPEKSLAIQADIVQILDTFTAITAELTAALTAELSARKKQYNYYRDHLLNFDEVDVEWKSLGSICNFVSSGTNKKRSAEGNYPVFGSTGVIAQTDSYAHEGKQILVARVGANAGYVHIADGKYDVSDNTIIVNVKEDYSLKFLFYILTEMNLRQYAKGGGQPLITSGELKKLRIPIPHAASLKRSIAEQTRIADILEKFDTLTTSISEGLPREIELRQKQYVYYRDLMLRFPKPEGMAA